MGNVWAGGNRLSRCCSELLEQEGKWFAVDTFMERRTVGAFSPKPVSWGHDWSSGKHVKFLFGSFTSLGLLFLSSQLVSVVPRLASKCPELSHSPTSPL